MDKKTTCGGSGMLTRICWVIGAGIILGVLLGLVFKAGSGWERAQLAALLTSGIALAYVLLAIADCVIQWLSLRANPLPQDLELSNRSIAGEQVQALKGGAPLQRQLRQLLAAWSAGASGPQVVAMAGNQLFRNMIVLGAETVGILIILAASGSFGPPQSLLTLDTGLMVLVVLTAIGRFQLATHLAGYTDAHLLAKIGNDTPAAAGVEFAQAAAKSVSNSTESLAASQTQFAEQLAKAQQDAAAQLAKAQEDAAKQLAQSQKDVSEQMAKAQTETAAKLSESQNKVAEQLGRVTELAGSIDQVLKLQQTVDGTIKGVTATTEFKETLVELKRHLAESDELLKNAAKPRTIRMVEQDHV